MNQKPGVHRLGDEMVNFYLIEDGSGVTLVDTGLPSHYDALVTALTGLGRSLDDIRAILLTHAHPDHLGLAERLREDTGATVWVSAADASMLASPLRPGATGRAEGSMVGYLLRRPAAIKTPLHLLRSGAFRAPVVSSMRTFDGPRLDVPGNPRVIPVPGHTDGSVAFHFPDHDTVCTGDALVTFDSITGGRGPRIVNRAFTHDSAAAMRSLGELAAVDASLVLPGHGDPVTGGIAAAVETARMVGVS
jgi:glyoxylase-like metal-dependent hydrolase (beta-lactamase superfamily II)